MAKVQGTLVRKLDKNVSVHSVDFFFFFLTSPLSDVNNTGQRRTNGVGTQYAHNTIHFRSKGGELHQRKQYSLHQICIWQEVPYDFLNHKVYYLQ